MSRTKRVLLLFIFALIWHFTFNWGWHQVSSWFAKGLVFVAATAIYGLGARMILLRP